MVCSVFTLVISYPVSIYPCFACAMWNRMKVAITCVLSKRHMYRFNSSIIFIFYFIYFFLGSSSPHQFNMAPWIASSVDSQKKKAANPQRSVCSNLCWKWWNMPVSQTHKMQKNWVGGWVGGLVCFIFLFFVFCLKCELILCLVM